MSNPNRVKLIFKYLFLSFLPAALIYFGKHDVILEDLKGKGIIGAAVNVELTKEVCFTLGILFSTFIIPLQWIREQEKRKKIQNNVSEMVAFTKELFILSLQKELKSYTEFNVRVLVKCKGIRFWYKAVFQRKVYFRIQPTMGLSDPFKTQSLEFQVSPKTEAEGIAGHCYNKRMIFYDDNVKENVKNGKYVLTEHQKRETEEIEFVLVTPIFNNANKIIALIAIDSTKKVNMSKASKNWDAIIKRFCKLLHKQFPNLHRKH